MVVGLGAIVGFTALTGVGMLVGTVVGIGLGVLSFATVNSCVVGRTFVSVCLGVWVFRMTFLEGNGRTVVVLTIGFFCNITG